MLKRKDAPPVYNANAGLRQSSYPLTWTDDIAICNLAEKLASSDEERHTGKLEYWGAFLMSTSGDTLLMDFLVSAMTMTDQFSFEVKNSLLHLEFFFELYNQVKMKDYSKEIEQLGLKIKELNTR